MATTGTEKRHAAWQRLLAYADTEPDLDCADMHYLHRRAREAKDAYERIKGITESEGTYESD